MEKKTDDSTVKQIARDTISGNAYFGAWSAIVTALSEADPSWNANPGMSAVENAVAWIARHGVRHAG